MEIHEYRINCRGRCGIYSLIPFGDIHLGTKNCDEVKLQETIDYIKNKENCYWIGMGDFLDLINYHDKRFDPESLANWIPTKKLNQIASVQIDRFVEYIKPIKHKCIGLLEGNHEESIAKYHDRKVVYDIIQKLGNGIKNLSYTCFVRLLFNRALNNHHGASNSIIIHASHGFGGGLYEGASLNRLLRQAEFWDAEIFLVGHCHKKRTAMRNTIGMSHQGLETVSKKRIFALTGSFYRGYVGGSNSYVEKKGYPPSDIGVVKITIEPFRQIRISGKTKELRAHLHISE